jgi:hypothetical protein
VDLGITTAATVIPGTEIIIISDAFTIAPLIITVPIMVAITAAIIGRIIGTIMIDRAT